MAACALTMRAEVRRNASGKGSYGGQKPAGWDIVADAMPCMVWVRTAKEVVDGKSAVVESIRGVFRPGADIQRGDQLVEIKNRRGVVVIAGPLYISAISPRTIAGAVTHQQVDLERVRG